jgi:Phage major capsid protein E
MEQTLYSTQVLTGIINQLRPDPRFFLNYFPLTQTHEEEVILFDETSDSLLVTPYSHPKAEAKTIEKKGYKTKAFRPAYLKSKIEFDPDSSITRLPGEAIGGNLSNAERERLNLVSALKTQRDMFERRLEQMAAEIIVTGKLKIESKEEFSYEVDFGRHPDFSRILDEKVRWNKEKVDIIEQFETWSQEVLDKSGGSVDTVVFGRQVWNAFRKNPSIEKMMELRRGVNSTVEITPKQAINGLQEKGTLGEFRLICHLGKYLDPNTNAYMPYVPEDSVLLLSSALDGVKHFGAIKDRSAQMRAMPYFVKSIEVEDPSALFILAQSAPLLVPQRPNASMCVKVI